MQPAEQENHQRRARPRGARPARLQGLQTGGGSGAKRLQTGRCETAEAKHPAGEPGHPRGGAAPAAAGAVCEGPRGAGRGRAATVVQSAAECGTLPAANVAGRGR